MRAQAQFVGQTEGRLGTTVRRAPVLVAGDIAGLVAIGEITVGGDSGRKEERPQGEQTQHGVDILPGGYMLKARFPLTSTSAEEKKGNGSLVRKKSPKAPSTLW